MCVCVCVCVWERERERNPPIKMGRSEKSIHWNFLVAHIQGIMTNLRKFMISILMQNSINYM